MGGAAAVQGAAHLASAADLAALMGTAAALAVVSGAALILGFLTPGTGVVAAATTLILAATPAAIALPIPAIDRMSAVLVIVDALALSLLGPGAHSMDAYLFGRREIVIPPAS